MIDVHSLYIDGRDFHKFDFLDKKPSSMLITKLSKRDSFASTQKVADRLKPKGWACIVDADSRMLVCTPLKYEEGI